MGSIEDDASLVEKALLQQYEVEEHSPSTLSASLPVLKPIKCLGFICPPATPPQYVVFFIGLYLIALGTSGIKACVSSFGADQFDDTDSHERIKKGSFFNWFYFILSIGGLISSTLLVWIQDNVGWGLGFGIPTLFMGLAIISFFVGTPLYRFQKPGGSFFVVAPIRKRNLIVPEDNSLLYETLNKNSAIEGSRKLKYSDELSGGFHNLRTARVLLRPISRYYAEFMQCMLFLSTSLGNYLSSVIVTLVTYFTTQGGKSGWIPNNLNEGRLDQFFWLISRLSFFNMSS
ncbi:unnamed protein product [Lupinus luteus]|uniref:Uncharacterized protein n=1 Tax=Lupinus luteus TaxID=3873 RepID=A0AAV1Y8G9_LUPLU